MTPPSDPDADARTALRLIGPDPQNWVPDRPGIDRNVMIVGGGQSGSAFAFALRRAGVGKVSVIDAAEDEARAGVWLTAARMNVLRTPKNLPGPELAIPALGFQSWYEARHGAEAYAAMERIPREAWAEYLGSLPEYLPWLEEGFRRAGNGKNLRDFEIQGSVHVAVNADVEAALAALKPEVALYVGGMGYRDKNSHKDIMVRRGYREAADRIQELYLAGRKEEAAAAVPDKWVDDKSLVGPAARIKQRYRAWADCGLTGLTIRSRQPQAIEAIAEAAGLK